MTNEAESYVIPESTEEVEIVKEPLAPEAVEGDISAEELKLAEDHGVLKVPEPEPEEEPEPVDFEEIYDDPKKEEAAQQQFNANEKAIYRRWKQDKKKRQAAENERDLLKIKLSQAEKKEPELEISTDEELPDDEKILTVADFKRMKQEEQNKLLKEHQKRQEVRTYLDKQEAEFKEGHQDFDEVTHFAEKFISDFKYSNTFRSEVERLVAEGGNVAEYVYELGQKAERIYANDGLLTSKKSGKSNIDKMVANSAKRTTSASLGGGAGGARTVTEDDLTPEDVAKMSDDQYNRLSERTRKRILQTL